MFSSTFFIRKPYLKPYINREQKLQLWTQLCLCQNLAGLTLVFKTLWEKKKKDARLTLFLDITKTSNKKRSLLLAYKKIKSRHKIKIRFCPKYKINGDNNRVTNIMAASLPVKAFVWKSETLFYTKKYDFLWEIKKEPVLISPWI